ncbi:MAG: molybdenum cofactor guanylyltransferase MobA [Gammaproteobacteria bacterium]
MNPAASTYSASTGHSQRITGVILAGGRGSRMDGADKGLLEISGTTFLAIIAKLFEPQVSSLVISANRNLSAYKAYGYPVVTDSMGGYPGPLGGILSAMDHCDTELLLTVPCDAPLLAADYSTRMYRSMINTKTDACVAHDGTRMQPVYSLLHCKHIKLLRNYLETGNHSVQHWIQSLTPALVDFSDRPEQFYNLNTSADRKTLEEFLQDRQ